MEGNRAVEGISHPDKTNITESPDALSLSVDSGSNRLGDHDISGTNQLNKSPSPERKGETVTDTRYGDNGYIIQEMKREVNSITPERAVEKDNRISEAQTNSEVNV